MNKNEQISKQLINNYDVSMLYSTSASQEGLPSPDSSNGNNFSIIGLLEIKKIDLKYPILSHLTDYSLEIAPCRFYGPNPNEIGNLCIASHNYDDNKLFGNLFKLEISDIIDVYDMAGNPISYIIYDIYETDSKDTRCTSQETGGYREVSLVTCNNITKDRLVIKAKEQEYTF